MYEKIRVKLNQSRLVNESLLIDNNLRPKFAIGRKVVDRTSTEYTKSIRAALVRNMFAEVVLIQFKGYLSSNYEEKTLFRGLYFFVAIEFVR
jgi:hypothetical protein